MKIKCKIWSFAFTLAGLFCSCTIIGEGIKPSKNYITRDYTVKEFNQIEASTVGDINYTQSTDGKTSVQIYGPDNYVKLIQVTMKNETLILDIEKGKQMNNCTIKITLSSPSLNRIDFKGVGNILIEKSLKAPKLDVTNKGVGNIKILDLTCDDLIVNSVGVGNMVLRGSAQTADLSSKGVGNINAVELKADSIEAFSKGVGDITCYPTQSIKASVKGVGSIEYKGNPTEKKFTKGGIGSIKSI